MNPGQSTRRGESGTQSELERPSPSGAGTSARTDSLGAPRFSTRPAVGWGNDSRPTFGFRPDRASQPGGAAWAADSPARGASSGALDHRYGGGPAQLGHPLDSVERESSSALRAAAAIQRLLDRLDAGARSISFEFDPTSLPHRGLEVAVRELAREVGARYGVTIRVEDDGRLKATDEKERVVLFRSILELVVNAAKHTHAQRMCVTLERGERSVQVTLEDDGICTRSAAASAGFSSSSIRERLGHIGGSMHIESVPEHGTKICLCAPLASDRTTNSNRTTNNRATS